MVCRCLTCRVQPKTPIISMAMHRYSEKTSHHGFSTRSLEFGSVPRFFSSPTGIILAAAAAAPRWRGKTGGCEHWGQIMLSTQCRTSCKTALKSDAMAQRSRVCVRSECWIRYVHSDYRLQVSMALNTGAACSCAQRGFKVDKLVWQQSQKLTF